MVSLRALPASVGIFVYGAKKRKGVWIGGNVCGSRLI